MSKAWIVAADAARARILSADSPTAPLKLLHELVSPAARLHERDLASDRPGRVYDSVGGGRHATSTATSPKEQEAMRFAKIIAKYLERGRINNDYDRLLLVCEPHFLGLIRKAIKDEVAKLVAAEIDKDLSKVDTKGIRKSLPERI